MRRRPSSFAVYRTLTRMFQPVAPLFLHWRRMRGKEDRLRMSEKLGLPSQLRPPGPLAWLHGASVGEGLALLPLAERLIQRGFHVLLTTGTATSAAVLAQRLSPGAIHQFGPLDAPRFVDRFLDHWRPDLALIAESELWPNMLVEAGGRRVPLMLVNARLSQRSFNRWRSLMPDLIAAMLNRFDLCLAQSQADADRLRQLGAPRVTVAGNLKYDVAPPPVDSAGLARLQAEIGARPVWMAASTHAGEEMLAGEVHGRLVARFPGLLTIIAPRHATRGDEIAVALGARGARVGRRSRGDAIDTDCGIYLADTMGEMGLLFRLAPIVFLGKSLSIGTSPSLGGQNPIEPAKLGCAILHGPHVGNFEEVYSSLDAAEGAAVVEDAGHLAAALSTLLGDAALLRRMARNALEAVSRISGATERTMQQVEPYLIQTTIEQS